MHHECAKREREREGECAPVRECDEKKKRVKYSWEKSFNVIFIIMNKTLLEHNAVALLCILIFVRYVFLVFVVGAFVLIWHVPKAHASDHSYMYDVICLIVKMVF